MKKVLEFLAGKKTYLVALAGAVLAIWQSQGHAIPEWVFELLGAVGLGTLRAGIKKSET